MQVAWDTSGLKVLTKDGKICETCCAPPIPTGDCSILPSCLGEVGNTSNLCCFGGNTPPVNTPKYLVVSVHELYKCSDNQVIADFSICLTQTANSSIWAGSITLESNVLTAQLDWSGLAYDSCFGIYNATIGYYDGWGANYCSTPNNRLLVTDCNTSYDWFGGYGDTLTVKGYGGHIHICNPLTGEAITAC